jgi:hypothetical protein
MAHRASGPSVDAVELMGDQNGSVPAPAAMPLALQRAAEKLSLKVLVRAIR